MMIIGFTETKGLGYLWVDRFKPLLQTTAELSGLEYVDSTEVSPNWWAYRSLV
jgi:hypothetical protein